MVRISACHLAMRGRPGFDSPPERYHNFFPGVYQLYPRDSSQSGAKSFSMIIAMDLSLQAGAGSYINTCSGHSLRTRH